MFHSGARVEDVQDVANVRRLRRMKIGKSEKVWKE